MALKKEEFVMERNFRVSATEQEMNRVFEFDGCLQLSILS